MRTPGARSRLAAPAALLLLLAAAAPGAATWSGLLAPATPVLELAGQGGLVGVLAGAVGEPPQAPQPGPAPGSGQDCGGTAPVTGTCGVEFQAPAGATWKLFSEAGTGFTGTIVATLTDARGAVATWTCSYVLFVGGVSPAPACSGSGGDLAAGTLRLTGAVSEAASGNPSAGLWEVAVTLS